jgi:hypothetical protein
LIILSLVYVLLNFILGKELCDSSDK